ncbi:MAG: BMP family ABC transporter substrate-binding protein, partial [Clostridia bacterium]|nr:BMP family ABC transporter substrate-binding protein [Clostridia bacterium]
MKRHVIVITIFMLVFSFGLTGCGGNDTPDPEGNTGEGAEALKIALLINGTLGDKSFFDSADNGLKMIQEKYGDEVVTKTIEMTYDETKWEPTLRDVSDDDWDIIIVGTWQMQEMLQDIAPMYPEKNFIIFDTAVDYENFELDNVYSINYKQNEGSFLAGVLAARVTTSEMELANPDKRIGFLGGMDIPVINDFLVGYIEGAQYIDSEMKVKISYIGNFDDSAKGKELALAQYGMGADIGFNVAGQGGLGQLDAAKEMNKYAIGVDSDQALLFTESDPEKANLIVTSMLKRVDNSLVRAIELHMEGALPYGSAENLGMAEEAIGLADNEYY